MRRMLTLEEVTKEVTSSIKFPTVKTNYVHDVTITSGSDILTVKLISNRNDAYMNSSFIDAFDAYSENTNAIFLSGSITSGDNYYSITNLYYDADYYGCLIAEYSQNGIKVEYQVNNSFKVSQDNLQQM